MRHTTGIAVAALLLAACSEPAPDEATPQAPATVEVRPHCSTGDPDAQCVFEPAEVTIQAGGTVRWINDDAVFHTVTSSDELDVRRPNGLFDAVLDDAGETFERTFDEPGTFPYYCQPHAEFMAGLVRVVAG